MDLDAEKERYCTWGSYGMAPAKYGKSTLIMDNLYVHTSL